MEVQDRMSFKGAIAAGTKVKMSEQGKKAWHDEESNPHNMEGVVLYAPPISIKSLGFVNKVSWDNGRTNSYKAGDLDIVEEADAQG